MKNFLKFDKPFALTFEEWDEFDEKNKEAYPIKWFLVETLPDWVYSNIWSYIRRLFVDKIYWGLKYRFQRKHQYNIIRPATLEPGYYDPLDVMIHSNFHILKEFIDYEVSDGHVDWQATPQHQAFWAEANEILDWWNNIRPMRAEQLSIDYPYPKGPEGSPSSWLFKKRYYETEEYKAWTDIAAIRREHEVQFERDDEEYLIRLMKIRLFLWD